MKKRFHFEPSMNSLTLEDRVVLTHSPVPSAIVDAYVRDFQTELQHVSTDVNNAITQTLLGGNNSTPTPQSRTDYDAQVKTIVDNAETVLDNVLSLSPLAEKQFTGQINDLLTGTQSTSLISGMNALTTPASTGAAVDTFTVDTDKLIHEALKKSLVGLDKFFSSDYPLRQAVTSGHQTQISLEQSYNTQFNAAFTSFSTSYSQDVTTILLAGSDPTKIPTNRTAFDQQVATDANMLNNDLADMLALFPNATKDLTKAVDDRLISGKNSMLVQLNALASPTDLNGSSAKAFRDQSTTIINQAQTDVLDLLNTGFKHWRRNSSIA